MTIPDGIRLFIRDALEGAVVALTGLTFVIPGSLDAAKAEGLVVITAVGGAVLAVARRELWPIILNWIFPTPPPPPSTVTPTPTDPTPNG